MSQDLADLVARITKGKRSIATKHLTLYCEDGSPALEDASEILSLRETALLDIAEFLEVSLDEQSQITLVLYESPETKIRETGHTGNGWAFGRTMIELYNDSTRVDPYHELVHIVAGRIGKPPAIFDEGLAVYLPTQMLEGQSIADLYRQALSFEREYPSLAELLEFTEIGPPGTNPEVAYPLSGAVAGFLLERDKVQFLELFRWLQNPLHPELLVKNREVFETVTGHEVDSLVRGFWRTARHQAEGC